jgi:transcriptional/translational regulatory protein YebC/TACO1
VALLIECLSDNRNRAASEVRVAVTRNGGNMADPGSVSYLFNRKGVVIVSKNGGKVTEDSLLEVVLDVWRPHVQDHHQIDQPRHQSSRWQLGFDF